MLNPHNGPMLRQPPPHLYRAWKTATSHCIQCGFCLPACPTYRETGREAASPRGRLDLMTAVARGEMPLERAREALSLCLGCLACETACPSGIRYRDMLEAGRADLFDQPRSQAQSAGISRVGWLGRWMLSRVMVSPPALRRVAWLLFFYQRSGLQALVRGSMLLRLLAPGLARLEAGSPPVPLPVNWRARMAGAGLLEGTATDRKSVAESAPALFTGCVMDAVFGEVHLATAQVLAANGLNMELPKGQGCCGALHQHSGEAAQARELAKANIIAFESQGRGPIVLNSAGCGAFLKDYGALLSDDPDWEERAAAFSGRVIDICEYLATRELKPPPQVSGSGPPLRVAYDDPCHLAHAQKVSEAPRKLLAMVPGLEMVKLEEAEMCCGSAGSYSLTQPEMSRRLLDRKMAHVKNSGASVVATGNPGCLLQIRLGAKRSGLGIRVMHPVELLARAYRREGL